MDEIINKDTIEYLKENKDQITMELLDRLRERGNKGKQIALDILDIPKDEEQYYLDAFGNRLSFNGNRRLKKPFNKLNLADIHIAELKRCAEDIHYFKDNYVKIKTKEGVNFPELREYQNEYIEVLDDDDNPDVIGLMGRQCCSAGTTVKIINNSVEQECTFEELFNACKDESVESYE